MKPIRKRPRVHFTPPSGWMNDPNGLYYHNGKFHLYYQYDPDNMIPLSLHWGHAVSSDFINWEHCPIALYPDEYGLIYSGNIIEENKSLFENNESDESDESDKKALASFFTYHYETENGYFQSQGMAYSLDGGYIFHKSPFNPILTFNEKDFRDPMLFFDEDNKRWIMAVVAGRSVRFYGSKTLTEWEFLSSFIPKSMKSDVSEIWECPCIVKMTDSYGKKYHVLFVSVFTEKGQRFGMQYYVGSFEGNEFVSINENINFIDGGLDFYAGIVYGGISDRIIMQAWLNCWYYARQSPTASYRGSMSFPRELFLYNTEQGIHVGQKFATELEFSFDREEKYTEASVIKLKEGTAYIELNIENENNSICFSNASDDISIDLLEGNISIDRSRCGGDSLGEIFGRPINFLIQNQEKKKSFFRLEILLDINSIEIICNNKSCSLVYYIEREFNSIIFKKPVLNATIKYFNLSSISSNLG